MKQDRLIELIEHPEVHREILGDYEGGYSLGVTLNPENRKELAIRVRIEGEDTRDILRQVTLDEENVPIIISTGFKRPVPLNAVRNIA
jgi:hypothetical protein